MARHFLKLTGSPLHFRAFFNLADPMSSQHTHIALRYCVVRYSFILHTKTSFDTGPNGHRVRLRMREQAEIQGVLLKRLCSAHFHRGRGTKRHLPQTHGFLQHWLFRSQSLVQTEACTQMGCSGMGDSSSGSPEGLRCSPLLCRWKLFFWAALSEHGGACNFGPLPPLPWPLGHVRLISFLGLVCAALLFFSTC